MLLWININDDDDRSADAVRCADKIPDLNAKQLISSILNLFNSVMLNIIEFALSFSNNKYDSTKETTPAIK